MRSRFDLLTGFKSLDGEKKVEHFPKLVGNIPEEYLLDAFKSLSDKAKSLYICKLGNAVSVKCLIKAIYSLPKVRSYTDDIPKLGENGGYCGI